MFTTISHNQKKHSYQYTTASKPNTVFHRNYIIAGNAAVRTSLSSFPISNVFLSAKYSWVFLSESSNGLLQDEWRARKRVSYVPAPWRATRRDWWGFRPESVHEILASRVLLLLKTWEIYSLPTYVTSIARRAHWHLQATLWHPNQNSHNTAQQSQKQRQDTYYEWSI